MLSIFRKETTTAEQKELKGYIDFLVKELSRIDKESFKTRILTSRTQENIDMILLKLGLLDEKGCYDSFLVIRVVRKLESEYGIRLNEKQEKLADKIRLYLASNSANVGTIVNNFKLDNADDIEKIIKILKDKTINENKLETIIKILLSKPNFIRFNQGLSREIEELIKTIVSHPYFGEKLISYMYSYTPVWLISHSKTQSSNNSFGQSHIRKKNKSRSKMYDIDLIFFKSIVIIHSSIDFGKYVNSIEENEYLTIIKSIFENSRFNISTKKAFLMTLEANFIEEIKNKVILNLQNDIDKKIYSDFAILAQSLKSTLDLPTKNRFIDKKDYSEAEYICLYEILKEYKKDDIPDRVGIMQHLESILENFNH